jgi:aryl carrier-like protein
MKEAEVGDTVAVELQSLPEAVQDKVRGLLDRRIELQSSIKELEEVKKGLDGTIQAEFATLGVKSVKHPLASVAVVSSPGRETLDKEKLQMELVGMGLDPADVVALLSKCSKAGAAYSFVKVTYPKGA